MNEILIIEDELLIALNIRASLKQIGYDDVFITSNTDNAYIICEKTCPRVIIADVRLQGKIDGLKFIEWVYPICPKSFFIIISAYSDLKLNELENRVSLYNNSKIKYIFLSKPLRMNQLTKLVDDHMKSII